MTAQKKIIIIIILFALGGGLWWYNNYRIDPDAPQSKTFNGQFKNVTSDSVFVMDGSYILDDKNAVAPGQTKTVSIEVNPNTKIVKTLVYLPSSAELKATNGRYDPSKLKRETTTMTVADLLKEGKNNSVSVIANQNIYGQDVIKASQISEINYIVPIYP